MAKKAQHRGTWSANSPRNTLPTTLVSCTGTTSNSSAAAHTNRCWSLRCSQVNASRAKFRSLSMKSTSRLSRPGRAKKMVREGRFRRKDAYGLSHTVHPKIC